MQHQIAYQSGILLSKGDEYFARYDTLMKERGAATGFWNDYGKYDTVCLVGAATKKRKSHSEELKKILTDSMEV